MENRELIILDGGMGTMLQAAGLPVGQIPELWNCTQPEKVAKIQRKYVEAGSRVLYTNTFGVNRFKAAGCGCSVAELVEGGVSCARMAGGDRDVKVALDIGPLGQLLEPLGTLRFEDAYEAFREILVSGEQTGADFVIIETMSDLYEVKAAVLAAKENTHLPVWVTMTFEASGRTFLGTTVPAMGLTLSGLGVDAMGFNCSLGPEKLLPLIEELSHWTDRPLILKPNAGLPDPATGEYHMTAGEFARELVPALNLGVSIFGGCCGTTPEFIRALSGTLKGMPAARRAPDRAGVCSASNTACFDGVRVIGERINPTGKKRFQQALREADIDYIVARGIEQQDAGAEILDVNVGLPGIDEPAMMRRVVKALQAVVDLPLQIDSSDPAAIEAGLRAVNGKAIVNSVNGKPEVLAAVLPLCKKYGAAVVGLCMDSDGIPQDWMGRCRIAERILDAALSYGIPREDVLIDCLTLTVSAQQEQAEETLRAVRYVTEELGLHTVLGVSNISFGLPAREQITVSFLTRASGGQMSIADAIMRGLRQETKTLATQALEQMSEMEVVDRLLIPALDAVGERYERQEIFLPQLINAANAACEGFELVKQRIAQRGGTGVSRGRIVLATVQGDIHDIGKNIVRVVLENYGYTVIDLGRDVPAKEVVDAVIRENVSLVGLSALMTTTVASMAETIAAIRASEHDCKIMVGGAVLTPDYAAQIGADYYAKDAKQSADIAKRVLG